MLLTRHLQAESERVGHVTFELNTFKSLIVKERPLAKKSSIEYQPFVFNHEIN